MTFDFLSTKKAARQALHKTLGVRALHIDHLTGAMTDVDVRAHTKIRLAGDIDYQGFAELSDGAVMIHCAKEQAHIFKAEDLIIYDSKIYKLNTRRDDDGIYLDSWYAIYLNVVSDDEMRYLMRSGDAKPLLDKWA